ncbi:MULTISPECIES: acetylornithine deacetylase [Methylosinus]|uniref:Acetylornithine deacetylase n=1 Tax=Methylosinus trichosporium (strain ATCC 35070 / NCIMB 11131 / UNIQEM 75 / OB3b) TaxID=595536 RepID=A0A2D2CWB8_METT3|nr:MULTISPECIES: acetylornithine deacetylase [Methylosinus]ATQ66966.1 acetylornithine deacetylase [Methylosinus trichosporium OB3b]OBS54066.1 acetylornithine deacetylase (ArgE) [Methylosinus sp. 3S-1]
MSTLERTIELTGRLVAFDTESSRSNLPLIDFVADYLRGEGVPFVVAPNATGDKAALFATIGPNVDGGIVLSGHTDVVPVAGQNWTGDPFALRREGERLIGRGAVDMKGFGAVCLAMVPEFKAAALQRPIHIFLSYDEETTCLGPLDLIARFGDALPRPGAAVIGEPTSMRVADAHKSVSTYVTRVVGHEIHSANLHRGASAVHAAALVAGELLRLGEELVAMGDPTGRFDPPWSSLHIGVIQGGTARNIVAKDCAFHWEVRGVPGIDAAGFVEKRLAAFTQALNERYFAAFPGTGITTEIEVAVPGLAPQPGSPAETLALRLARANHTVAVPYASEAGQFQRAGIASVICGPGRIDEAHQPDEYIEVAQLAACVEFMRSLARELGA